MDERAYYEHIKNLVTELDGLTEDLAGVCAEAKEEGFDAAMLKRVAKAEVAGTLAKELRKGEILREVADRVGSQIPLPLTEN